MRSLLAAALVMTGAMAALASPSANMRSLPTIEAPIVQVQSRSCRACRNSCSIDRRYCGYANYCRGEFTACMRACWENVCR